MDDLKLKECVDAYFDGRDAGAVGAPYHNPHVEGTEEYRQYARGWKRGQDNASGECLMSNRPTIEQYADEIFSDLQQLAEQYPDGIHFQHLNEYYGETTYRTSAACKLLHEKGKLVLDRKASGAMYIPTSDNLEYNRLSVTQRKVLRLLQEACQKSGARKIRTNYLQLSRVLGASYGGIRQAICRLQELKFVEIASPSTRGHQNELVLILCEVAHHKTS